MTRAILLIDMDAFFAAVEQARRPELRGRPVIVGGSAESRGVVSTASYEARACGVRTAMPDGAGPSASARRASSCPSTWPPTRRRRAGCSSIYRRFTDLVEPVSIDEAFLDVTGSRRLFGSPQEIAARSSGSRARSSASPARSASDRRRLLAKLAAELEKPGGLTTLTRDDVHGRLRSMPVGAISGIGPVTVKRLRALASPPSASCRTRRSPLLEASFATDGRLAQGARLRRRRRVRCAPATRRPSPWATR